MANITQILRDAENEKLVLQRVDSATGDVITDADATNYGGDIILELGGCLGSDGNYHKLYLQEVCCTLDGVEMRTIVLMCDPFDAP